MRKTFEKSRGKEEPFSRRNEKIHGTFEPSTLRSRNLGCSREIAGHPLDEIGSLWNTESDLCAEVARRITRLLDVILFGTNATII